MQEKLCVNVLYAALQYQKVLETFTILTHFNQMLYFYTSIFRGYITGPLGYSMLTEVFQSISDYSNFCLFHNSTAIFFSFTLQPFLWRNDRGQLSPYCQSYWYLVFWILLNIHKEVLKVSYLFLQKVPSYMFERVLNTFLWSQKQPSRGFLRIGVLKICSQFTGEYPRQSKISIKL